MKLVLLISVFVIFFSCKTSYDSKKTSEQSELFLIDDYDQQINYAKTITASELKKDIYIFASDSMEGRATGEIGQKKAAEFLKERYSLLNIPNPKGTDSYFQEIPEAFFNGRITGNSENVLAYIEGTTYPDELLVVSAHYDHLGIEDDGSIYNGADDDASGTMGLVQIAEAFALAKKEGKGPKRSILFLHVTGEEIGLYGSRYYTENPIFPLKNTIANLNVDMIGRVDDNHINDRDYIYLIGSDRLSKELHDISELVNEKYSQFDFDYTFNEESDPNRFYYRSDHYNFAKHNIPIIFNFNGVHDDYHETTDTPEKIEYDLLVKRCRLIFHTAWELANRNDRVKLLKK